MEVCNLPHAFSIRCMPTSTRSAPMRSTGKAGISRRSTGSPGAARTRCACRRFDPALDRHRKLQRRLGRRGADRGGRKPGAPQRADRPARRTGADRKQQASSHPHTPCSIRRPLHGRADKGLDRVFVFRLDAASGKLTPNDPPFAANRASAGPRTPTRSCHSGSTRETEC
jgi:hypothetical protein